MDKSGIQQLSRSIASSSSSSLRAVLVCRPCLDLGRWRRERSAGDEQDKSESSR